MSAREDLQSPKGSEELQAQITYLMLELQSKDRELDIYRRALLYLQNTTTELRNQKQELKQVRDFTVEDLRRMAQYNVSINNMLREAINVVCPS